MNQTHLKEPEIKMVGIPQEAAPSSHTDHDDDHHHGHTLNWRDINRVLFVAAAAGAIWFVGGWTGRYITVVGVVCTLVGGFPIFHEAYENIFQRRMTMELSMTIAIVAALAIREVFTALVITLFVLGAEILEGLTVGRGRRAIQRLIDLLPRTATVRERGNDGDSHREFHRHASLDDVFIRLVENRKAADQSAHHADSRDVAI